MCGALVRSRERESLRGQPLKPNCSIWERLELQNYYVPLPEHSTNCLCELSAIGDAAHAYPFGQVRREQSAPVHACMTMLLYLGFAQPRRFSALMLGAISLSTITSALTMCLWEKNQMKAESDETMRLCSAPAFWMFFGRLIEVLSRAMTIALFGATYGVCTTLFDPCMKFF